MVKSALETRLEAYAGKPVGVVMRTAQEMQNVLRDNPFPEAEPNKVGTLFLDVPPSPETLTEAKGRVDEDIRLGAREVFVHYPSGIGQSKLRLSTAQEGTMRNINTVAKLVEMAG